ncbi:hypothetical protein BpHYR1_009137 [Brachionus plicatilis]|uniref:Uncharacterized protein n=1 Tax=Brachionus plicatilis TaxID=10195 RepID=A0A3M7Q0S2_BRAPC|nr:hypothetical protein BpHYR1_009137 [Brachionus plicatilis]
MQSNKYLIIFYPNTFWLSRIYQCDQVLKKLLKLFFSPCINLYHDKILSKKNSIPDHKTFNQFDIKNHSLKN